MSRDRLFEVMTGCAGWEGHGCGRGEKEASESLEERCKTP
jgi:hypothetical protein